MSAKSEVIGAGVRPRGRSRVVGTVAGVKVKGSPVPKGRTASVLLASEGRAFTPASIALATDLARGADGTVHVLSIARVHGVAFGLQAPGLIPTKAEWDEQHEIVHRAVSRLRRRGLRAEGQVLGTRKPAQRICALAGELGSGAIVMGADPSRARVVRGMLWSQEPQAVERRSKVPVHLAIDEAS
ncbi:MAG TPA: universal stress protein [Solirubrobacteraceae bacterium]|jgi:nucleotide-binding universal stress UspA family protein|nr:universal stress protein [Solirubrobacteraceae bacterium]